MLHRHLDRYAQLCCPVLDVFGQTYHWSIMQAEYSTDLVFKSEKILGSLYQQLAREAALGEGRANRHSWARRSPRNWPPRLARA
ncbi:MAG: hypothetical protein IPI02_12235 [Sterolibacteriaceae bacterium]|nr:hypothetical protein [Sterolibacteriaceae bacterium]